MRQSDEIAKKLALYCRVNASDIIVPNFSSELMKLI